MTSRAPSSRRPVPILVLGRLRPSPKRWLVHRREDAISAVLRSRLAAWAARRYGRQIVLVLGESNLSAFREVRRGRLLAGVWLDIVLVPGASAMGITNEASVSQALRRFRAALAETPLDRLVVVLLGRADVGFLIWARGERDGTSTEVQLARSIASYTTFLSELVAAGRTIAVGAIPPQVVHEADLPRSDALDRHGVTATIGARNAATRRYNAALRGWCSDHGVRFLDWEWDTTDPATATVRAQLRPPDPTDIHLEPSAFARVIAPHMRELLDELGAPWRAVEVTDAAQP